MTFLASKKKIEFLRQLEGVGGGDKGVPALKLLTRDKDDKDKKNFAKLVDTIKESNKGKTLGVFARDKFPGSFMDLWRDALKPEGFETVDLTTQFGYLMAPKEESEVHTIKKAALLSSDIFDKYLKDHIADIIDGDKKKSHSRVSKDIEDQIQNKDNKLLSGKQMLWFI